MVRKRKNLPSEPIFSKQKGVSSKSKHNSIIQSHEEYLEKLQQKNPLIDIKKTELEQLEREKLVRIKKEKDLKYVGASCYLKDLDVKITSIKQEIEDIASGKTEIDYLLHTFPLLDKYLQINENEQELLGEATTEESNLQLYDINQKKQQLIHEYTNVKNKKYTPDMKLSKDNHSVVCPHCNVFYLEESGFVMCPECGLTKPNPMSETKGLSFKEMMNYEYKPQFAYQKRGYLEEWLKRFQASENKAIPQEVYDKLLLEIKKERITDLNTLTEQSIKTYLKRLNLKEYYENIITILNRLNKRPPFKLSREIEDKIIQMFLQIQEPFQKHKPNNRKSFLSYPYTLNKLFRILGLNEFSKYFPLLKSAEKLRVQDEIFKKIVEEMKEKDPLTDWTFYPSL